MNKILRPMTIIPTELYVERKADKQLAQIMSDMGRPGYILVARQMGKTNLLINAKRKYSTGSNIIVYIDLSNRYETDRLCFRSIIDTILFTNEEKLGHLIEKIHSDREARKIPAYTEHSAELRLILDSITGKLIIILDEIDSLTAADYSDKIFAQIRSVYFERVNFSCLERLTYVLSGVAEPSEIIKDKSISPFNIGQRIVLGDFDFSEFSDFIKKTQLKIPQETIDKIFYWTNGNPRMTWDICSEVEDILLTQETALPEDIDNIVEKTYLTNFDVPPVDHIRALVESSQELRDGIIAVLYGKDETISNEVKSKLYLAGILDSKFSEGIVRIKNKIIERSLDENWLESIISNDFYSKINADNAFKEQKFDIAIEQYIHLLRDSGLDELDEQLVLYRLACSYFYLGDYDNAVSYLERCIFDKKNYKAVYIEGMYIKSICQLALQRNLDTAISVLNEIRLDTDKTDDYHWLSSLNIVSAARQYNSVISQDESIEILSHIIENKEHIKSHNILSIAYLFAGDNENSISRALEYYLLSVNHASGLDKVKPYLHAIRKDSSIEHYNKVSELLIEKPDSKRLLYSNPSNTFNVDTLFEYISYSLENDHKETLTSVLDAFIAHDNQDEDSDGPFSRIILSYIISISDIDDKRFLCTYLLEKGRSSIPSEVIFGAAKRLLFTNSDNQESAEIYFSGFQNYVEGRPDHIDISNFEARIVDCMQKEETAKALTYTTQILYNSKNLDDQEQIKLLFIYYLRMVVSNEDEQRKIYEKITELLSMTESSEKFKNYYPQEILRDIKKHSTNLYRKCNPIVTVKHEHKFGRNDKVEVLYKNGATGIGKYKKFQDDILAGKCIIKL